MVVVSPRERCTETGGQLAPAAVVVFTLVDRLRRCRLVLRPVTDLRRDEHLFLQADDLTEWLEGCLLLLVAVLLM